MSSWLCGLKGPLWNALESFTRSDEQQNQTEISLVLSSLMELLSVENELHAENLIKFLQIMRR